MKRMAIACVLTASVCLGGARRIGPYHGVVFFDRWGTCYLFSGVYLEPISERVKARLKKYAGQSVIVNTTKMIQPMNPGDVLITAFDKVQTVCPTCERRMPLESLRLHAAVQAEKLSVSVFNDGPEPVTVGPSMLGVAVFANTTCRDPFEPSDGPSFAMVTRCSPDFPECGGSWRISTKLGVMCSVRASVRALNVKAWHTLQPNQSSVTEFAFTLPAGEYQFLAGYGGGVHASPTIVSNAVSFDADEQGRATVIKSGR